MSGTAGGNAATLASNATAWRARSGAVQPPIGAGGKKISFTADGNASATSFNIPHGFTRFDPVAGAWVAVAPTSVNLEPRNAVSAATHWVSAITSTNIVVTFAAAPAAGTANVSYLVEAKR